uniref:DUF5741 domain-containing protein n=1 Tax=Rodentolepis nana TaxID=102285 RepID=A0A0R3TYW3_RODNA
LLIDRERALLELYTPDTQTETNVPHAEDTDPTGEVTQYHHEPDSSIFNSTVDASAVSALQKEGNTQLEAISVELKLQHEVALLRSKLVTQIKANTRLKAAYNALSESNRPPQKVVTTNPPSNLSISLNPSILEEAGNTSQVNESFASLLNSNKKVSQTLDRTVNELKSALSKVEAELSASILEVSKAGEERKHEDVGVGVHDNILATGLNPDRLRDVYSLIKGLVDQFDNLRTFRSSFHETVNRSVLATSVCLDTSSRYAVPGTDVQTSQPTSFVESAGGENGGPSPSETSTNEYERIEPAVKSVAEKYENDELLLSVSQMSHNNTTFHLLREHCNDNTMEDLSMANSLSFTASQRSHALDITRLEIHSRDIFDRVAHAVAGIQEALDTWSLDAATELLAAINVNTGGIHQPPASSSHNVTKNVDSNFDTLLNLVIRFVEVLSKTKSLEVAAESAALFSDWCDLVYRWFEIFIDTLQGRRGSADLPEVVSRLGALELQFNEEFALTATVTQHPVTLSRQQNATLQVSDITEPPSVSLCENGDNVSSRCEQQLTSTIEKLKADLSLNVRELTDKEIAVADLKSKVQDLEAKLTETFSIARTKESKIEELEVEVANVELKAQDLERQLNEALSDTQAKGSKLEVLEAEIPQMETKLRELEAELREATLKARTKEMRVEELETEVNELKTRLQGMDAQLADALLAARVKDAKVEEMEAIAKDNESTLAGLKEQLAETETKLAQKQARVAELKVAANELRAIYDDLESQLNKANKDMEEWKAKSERLEDLLTESIERQTDFSQQLRQAFDEVNNLNMQKSALETQLQEKLESCWSEKVVELPVPVIQIGLSTTGLRFQLDSLVYCLFGPFQRQWSYPLTASEHNAKMKSTHVKYESLLEVAKSRYTEMAEQCERLQTERDNLCEDLQISKEEKLMLQTDLTMARMVSADAQINLGAYLEEGPLGNEKEDLEGIRQKARKYPELKSLAFTFKNKADRSAALLHDFTKENTRLKMIVSDHEKRVKELANELERLREQILVKNEVIKKLENLVRLSATDPPTSTLTEKPDEISPTENARGANFRNSNFFNTDATMDLVDGGILNSHLLPEHLNGVNSLMADIGATVREISGCLDPMTAEGGQQPDDTTSASLAAQISSLSTDTPSSLTVSFGDCGRGDHSRARKLVRRSVEALRNLNTRYSSSRSFTLILTSLNEALELLCRQNPSSSSSSASPSPSLTSLQRGLNSSRGPQEEETAAGIALPPPVGTTSSCSCSCRRRCSRWVVSSQEINTVLDTTAGTLARGRSGTLNRGEVEKVHAENLYVSPQDSLSN